MKNFFDLNIYLESFFLRKFSYHNRKSGLEDCILYAIDNNIQIKQQGIQNSYQKNSLDLAKLKLLPTINGTATHNYSFGRALDETTYQYTDQQNVQSNNFILVAALVSF